MAGFGEVIIHWRNDQPRGEKCVGSSSRNFYFFWKSIIAIRRPGLKIFPARRLEFKVCKNGPIKLLDFSSLFLSLVCESDLIIHSRSFMKNMILGMLLSWFSDIFRISKNSDTLKVPSYDSKKFLVSSCPSKISQSYLILMTWWCFRC